MGLDRNIDITPQQRKTILSLLETFLPNTTAWVYGSRVKWTSKPNSDLDMVVFSTSKQVGKVSLLKEAFDESDLPFRVDLHVWDDVPDQFRKNIEAERVVLFKDKIRIVANGWQEKPLEDCMEAIIDYRGKTPKKTTSGIPLITAKIVKNGAIQSVTEFIAEEDYESWMRRGMPQSGDVVMTTEAPLGEVAQLDNRKVALAQRIITLRGKKNFLDNRFLKYLISSQYVQHQLDGRGTGTTVRGIKQSELRRVNLRFPAYLEQKSIAHILGSLDDKIELNRQINATLEAMAQTLFKSWFVDFDPVIDNALAAGNEIPEALQLKAAARQVLTNQRGNDKLLPDHIRQQFPSAFEFNETMGWIPEGWEAANYSRIAALNSESWSNKNTPNNVQYVELSHTKNGRIFSVVRYPFSEAPSRARRVLRSHDTIIGTVRPANRSFSYIHADGLTGSTGFAVMRPLRKYYRVFIYLGLTQNSVIENFAHLADGAAYPAIRPEVIANSEIVIPSDSLLRAFDSLVYPWIERIGKQEVSSGNLAKLRDTLLPKLLSGELRIPDAEKLVQEVL